MLTPQSLTELSSLPFPDIERILADTGALRLPHDRSVAVFRHDDVAAGLANPELTVRHRFRTTMRLFGPTIIDRDGPDHLRQRRPVVRGMVDGRAEFLDTGIIDEIAARAVANLRGRPTFELIGDFAVRVVTEVIANLTGLSPAEALHLYTLYRPVVRAASGDESAFEEARANLLDALEIYANQDRLATGCSAPITHALEQAVIDNRLSEPELNRNRLLIYLGGTETTVGAISNILWMLATDRGLLLRLRKLGPGQFDAAVAELLRCQPPMFSIIRFAATSLDICGISVDAGTPVHLCLAVACRDPARFPDPHRPILTRPNSTNLMFGHGSHFCPGAAIANLELRAALRALMNEVHGIRLLDDPPPAIEGDTFRNPRTLNASLDWAT